MKIIFVGGVDIPAQGGIENYVFNLAYQLNIKGHQCRIICRGKDFCDLQINGVHITKIKVGENQFAILLHNIKASIRIFLDYKDVDVVNCQSIYLPFFYEWIPKLRGIKVVHTLHSFAQDNPKHGKLSRLAISFLYRVSALMFSPVITVSEHNRRLIKRRLWRDAKVINCGVEMPVNVEPTSLMKKLKITKGKYYLSIGRIDPVKNLDVLIKAFMRHEDNSPFQLVIAGNTENCYGQILKDMSETDKRIIFVGPVYEKDKAALLTNCMAFCLVSKSEGFPIAVLEAMSYGKVCLCSDIPSNEETLTKPLGLWSIVNDEKSLYESMLMLENNPEKFHELGAKMKLRIMNHLTWGKIADKYIDYLYSLFKTERSVETLHWKMMNKNKNITGGVDS